MKSYDPVGILVSAGCVLMGILVPGGASAAEEAIATDRPDFVESGSVVGKGVFQFETSVALERDRQGGVTTATWTTPTLLRYGISDTLELRLETDGFTSQRTSQDAAASTDSGFSNVALGFKWQLREGDEATRQPAIALLAHLETNSGSEPFRGPGAVPSLRMVAEWDLANDAAFGVMPGVAWRFDDSGNRYWSGILAATYSRPLSGRVRGFVELAGRDLRGESRGGDLVTFDTGLTFAVDKDTQLDAAINFGLNRFTPEFVLTIGVSKRFR